MTTTSRSEIRGRDIAARLAGTLAAFLAGRVRASQLPAELDALSAWIRGSGEVEKPPVAEDTTAIEQAVFDYWCKALGKKSAKFTRDRRAKVRARLSEGYTLTDIRRAIDTIAQSSFHRGENSGGAEYTDLTLICRSGAKLEGYRDKAPAPLVAATEGVDVEALKARAAEELREGNTHAYNRTQREIAAALGNLPAGSGGSGEAGLGRAGEPGKLAAG